MGGGVPVSHNALQHFPECHGEARGGTLPGPARGVGVPWPGGYPGQGGTLAEGGTLARGYPGQGGTLPGGTLAGGYPARGYPGRGYPGRGYPGQGGTLPGGIPWPGGVPCQGGTQLGQHREYLLHGGRYASCVHAGGLSCL